MSEEEFRKKLLESFSRLETLLAGSKQETAAMKVELVSRLDKIIENTGAHYRERWQKAVARPRRRS